MTGPETPMPEGEPITEQIEFQFAVLARALEAAHRRRAYPLERAPYLLLRILAERPHSVGELACELALDDSTVTRQIAAMEKAGLVEKTVNPDDRRSTLVARTAKGCRQTEAMHAMRMERIGATFATWSRGEQLELAAMLDRINRTIATTLSAGMASQASTDAADTIAVRQPADTPA